MEAAKKVQRSFDFDDDSNREETSSPTYRKDFIKCWLHANPEVSREEASDLYDALCNKFPNMTRGGHRAMVGRLKPWESVKHECPCCGESIVGIQKIKDTIGLRLMTYETKTKGVQKKVYFQSYCRTCITLNSAERREVRGGEPTMERINPEVESTFTNRSDAIQ